MVPPEQRRAFGEFYTPDWLAEMLAERILDDDWLRDSVESALNKDPAGVGVLDPSCGSGTFLYHAARRIVQYMKAQEYQDGKIAEVVSRLVYGIDIHPVAVEFSRANILRALPVDPPNGVNSINVIQGDSLIYTRAGIALENQENALYYSIETPLRNRLNIPVAWTDQGSFADDLRRFVLAANSIPARPMPVGIALGLSDEDTQMVENTFNTLIEVCRYEKDSVWGWYFQNIVGPSKLRRRKVNRILANPPWVRMSHIQTPERKTELEALANELNFWGHGKSNSSFDISSMFVKRCALNYLSPDGGLAAWLLQQAALDGTNWENVRNDPYVSAGAVEYMDLAKVRRMPFTVESCVWIQTHRPEFAEQLVSDDPESQPADTPTKILMNLEGFARLQSHTSWQDVQQLTQWVDAPRKLPKVKSDYFSEDNRPEFRMGATLRPYCLVKIEPGSLEIANDLASFTTAKSSKKPWADKGALNGRNVPTRWIRESVFSDSLFPFTVRRDMDIIVAPLGEDGLYDGQAENNAYWVNADSVYRDGKGRGGNTPQTLWRRLNFQNGLIRQSVSSLSDEGLRKVIYNKSGRIGIRAARISQETIINDKLYHYTCTTETEAAYLVALLNADILQEAYRQSQRTRRDFDLHLWSAVPIPRYDSENPDHLSLAALTRQAEDIAQQVRDTHRPTSGQIQISQTIHQTLRNTGIAPRIDEIAKRLMPAQATYGASQPTTPTTMALL